MNRTVVRHDFIDGLGKPGIKVTFYCENEPEALAVIAAGKEVPKPSAFIPALQAGPAFDSPEVVPLAGGSVGNAPRDAIGYVREISLAEARELYPPNCDGDARCGHEPTQSGQAAEILIELTEGDE